MYALCSVFRPSYAHTYVKYVLKRAQQGLILLRVRSSGNVSRPPADQFQVLSVSWNLHFLG